jgi:hypothetical protein
MLSPPDSDLWDGNRERGDILCKRTCTQGDEYSWRGGPLGPSWQENKPGIVRSMSIDHHPRVPTTRPSTRHTRRSGRTAAPQAKSMDEQPGTAVLRKPSRAARETFDLATFHAGGNAPAGTVPAPAPMEIDAKQPEPSSAAKTVSAMSGRAGGQPKAEQGAGGSGCPSADQAQVLRRGLCARHAQRLVSV